jgi:hypothetical protein
MVWIAPASSGVAMRHSAVVINHFKKGLALQEPTIQDFAAVCQFHLDVCFPWITLGIHNAASSSICS